MTSEQSSSRDAVPGVGEALESAVSAILRWSTRSDVRRSFSSSTTEVDLSLTDSWLMDRIARFGPIRISTLAAWQAVDRSTMTAQVQRLERNHMIIRAEDPADGRAILVRLSARGEALRNANRSTARAVFDELVGDWSEDDRVEFSRLLGRFVGTLDPGSEE